VEKRTQNYLQLENCRPYTKRGKQTLKQTIIKTLKLTAKNRKLKNALANASVLVLPINGGGYVLHTDANNHSMGVSVFTYLYDLESMHSL